MGLKGAPRFAGTPQVGLLWNRVPLRASHADVRICWLRTASRDHGGLTRVWDIAVTVS